MDLVTITRHQDADSGRAGFSEITLNRPGARNAIRTDVGWQLADACAQVAADGQKGNGARVVILSAAGDRAFCVGADLKERNAMSDEQIMAQRPVLRGAFTAVLGLEQPVVAAVSGYALGGGCELALSSDLIGADQTPAFALPQPTPPRVPPRA